MKIKRDLYQIVPATRDMGGAPLEPEERPARRVMTTDIPLTLGQKLITESMPGTIVQENITAGDVADAFRSRCADCKHFDRNGWLKYFHDLRTSLGDKGKQKALNLTRAFLDGIDKDSVFYHRHASPDNPDEIEQEHALRDLGFCRAMSELLSACNGESAVMVVLPEGGCEDLRSPTGEPFNCFQPRDASAQRHADAGYDAALRAAQGVGVVKK